ncbi:MAG: NAD-dependent epimerase/dehydratase family protein [Candidatus Levybacteria bacterium]|nr:NAD-dependent epimerase/dehydratase family protein [Candidatus Levybacteria bacterium]
MKQVLVSGSSGLIGSQAVKFFANLGLQVYGIDNDMRKYFFGAEASTKWNRDKLKKEFKDKYVHYNVDIRDNKKIEEIFKKNHFDLIIHAAAQPSHDWAAREPLTDFGVNANGTLNMLENYRKYSPDGVFIFTSTNKVYGDTPNRLPVVELATRWELPKTHKYYKGIDDTMSLDNSLHSLFGVAKLAADVMVQEYGRYFGLKTVSIRGGCLTGPAHSGTRLHGFLAYLIRCIYRQETYFIYGYKAKQVRDNIHAYDLVNAFHHFYKNPTSGQAYNLGGSRTSNTSILEAIAKAEKILGKKAKTKYVDQTRIGDHIWYISDNTKFIKQFPDFELTYDNDRIIEDICRSGHFD